MLSISYFAKDCISIEYSPSGISMTWEDFDIVDLPQVAVEAKGRGAVFLMETATCSVIDMILITIAKRLAGTLCICVSFVNRRISIRAVFPLPDLSARS